MANPGKAGDFDLWVTDRVGFDTLAPRAGDTGGMDTWTTNRIPFSTYQVAVAAGGTTVEESVALGITLRCAETWVATETIDESIFLMRSSSVSVSSLITAGESLTLARGLIISWYVPSTGGSVLRSPYSRLRRGRGNRHI